VRKLLKSPRTRSTRRTAREVQREEGAPVAHTTVLRAAKRVKLRFRVRPKKPMLTRSHYQQRLRFALKHRPRDYWKRVLASDEKTFSLFADVRGEWVDEGEEPRPRESHKWPGGLKVWGGTSWEGKTRLHFLPKSMKGKDYLAFIQEKAEPDLRRLYPLKTKPPTWLQDREGFHTAKIVQNYLKNPDSDPLRAGPATRPT